MHLQPSSISEGNVDLFSDSFAPDDQEELEKLSCSFLQSSRNKTDTITLTFVDSEKK